ncbi:hypothetical protein QCA50_011221 [Cerrena zonata]|uniref:DUF6535 domain-containing protein n=1 Tax=Cerrena zonata TaxID=2478898 RepID=A0AAW0G2H5_9APHY
MESEHPAQDDNLKRLEPTPPLDLSPEEIERNTVSIDATPVVESNQQHAATNTDSPKVKDASVPPNNEGQVHRVKIEPDRTGWGRISDLLRQYDRDRVEDVKEDIDTLLVFAGLFSAVITAFIIESYKTLQQQPEDTTNQILLQLSAQLASLTLSGSFVNSTIPPYTTSSFVPPGVSVLINTLWLLSLVFALITASLGILVKQWVHELMARDTQDPRQQVKLRFFREVGVQRWQVFEIAAALPLLLQLALLLFFIGLSTFLHSLNPVVTWVVTSVMIVWLLFYLFTTFSPVFSSQCPYKTPMLKGLLCRFRVGSYTWIGSFARWLYDRTPTAWHTIKRRCENLCDSLDIWSSACLALEDFKVYEDKTSDLPALVCSRGILRGSQLEETLTDCVQKCDFWHSFTCLQLLSQGKGPVAQGVLPGSPQESTRHTCKLFVDSIGEIVNTLADRNPTVLSALHIRMTYALLEVYPLTMGVPIPQTLLPMFIQLINENPTSAVFSVLTMYSVGHNIIERYVYPDSCVNLFPFILTFSGEIDERKSPGIGAHFVSNLVAAIRAICCSLWNRPQVESDVDMQNILYQINSSRIDSDPVIPMEPIALTYTFASILYDLTPRSVIREHRDILIRTMGELAGIITDPDGSSWPCSRQQCAELAQMFFMAMSLSDEHLVPKLDNFVPPWSFDSEPSTVSQWDY